MRSDSYKKIMKSTGIFGGVQLFVALTGILKTKVIALLLGAEGIGLYGLLVSTVSLLGSLFNCGIKSSGVRDLAHCADSEDIPAISKQVTIIYRYSLLMGIIGMLITLLFSRSISQMLFSGYAYTCAIAYLSVVVLIDQLVNAQLVILQGLRQLSFLAKTNLAGSFLSLCVAVPVLYVFGKDGIVPVIFLSSLLLLLRAWYYVRKLKIVKCDISWKKTMVSGLPMIKLGAALSLSSLIGMGSMYFLRVFVGRNLGMTELGFFNASITVIDSYVGMIFTAMATDYFPRLSSIHKDHVASAGFINEQSEMGIICIIPLIQWLITCTSLAVIVLYSEDFMPMIPLLRLLLAGTLFKAVVYAFDYYLIAQGRARIFMFNELLSWLYIVVCAVSGYYLIGFDGIGWGYLIGYFFSLIQSISVNVFFFRIRPSGKMIKLLVISFVLIAMNLSLSYAYSGAMFYLISGLISMITTLWSVYELNKRISLKEIVNKLFQNKKSK